MFTSSHRLLRQVVCTLIVLCSHMACIYAQDNILEPSVLELRNELQSPNEEMQLRALLKLSVALRWSKPERSIAYAEEAAVLAQKLQLGRALTSSYNKKGLTLWAMGSYKKALLQFQKSKREAKEFAPCFIQELQRNMAMCYIETKQADSALWAARASIKAPQECEGEETKDGIVEFFAGQAFLLRQQYDSAQYYFDLAQSLAANQGFENIIPAISREKGMLETEKGNYTKALDNLYASEKGFIEVKDSLQLEKTYRQIGIVHGLLDNGKLGFTYIRKALTIAQDLHLVHRVFLNYNELARRFEQQGKQDSALHYFQYCLELGDSALFDFEVYDLSLGIARCHAALGKGQLAWKVGNEALHQAVNENNIKGELECKLFLSTISAQEMPETAIGLSSEVLKRSRTNAWPQFQMDAAWVLYEVYKEEGDIKSALKYYRINRRLYDSLSNADVRFRTQNMNVTRALALKEEELLTLKLKLDEALKKSEITTAAKLFTGFLLLCIVLGSFLLLRLQKNKHIHLKKNNSLAQNLNSQTEKTLAQELSFKKRELIQFTLQIAHKNDFLETLKADIDHLAKQPMVEGKTLRKLSRHLELNIQSKNDWEDFKYHFAQVESGLLEQLNTHYAQLTRNDIRLCALLSMSVPNDEIARILNIQPESLRKAIYRLRQKMDLPKSESIEERLKTLSGKSPLPML